jgi:iron complex outermembrane receptor protein
LEASLVGAGNIRYLDTTIATTNVFQLFNYWDLTQYKNGQYLFANGWDNSTLNATGAGEDSHSKSQTLETGLGTLADLTAFKKLSLTVGARHDWINADLQNYPGLSTNGSTVMNAVAASHYKISQDRSSLTSASLSYKVLPNISPYITYATPRNIVPGQTGGLATAQLKGQVLTASKLREAGIKGEFFHKRLYVSFATYEQNRTVFNQSLNNNVGDFQQTRSDGQELEARWVPTKNFNMSAAMNWQQAYTVPLAPGFTPVPVTSTPLNPINFGGGRYQKAYSVNRTRKALPGQVFSVFGDYIFGNSGFDWSAGVNYTAGYYASTIQDIKLPSSLTVSTDVGYKTKKWEARLSVTNLTDTLFFTSTSGSAALIPQPGRTYTAKFTYKF